VGAERAAKNSGPRSLEWAPNDLEVKDYMTSRIIVVLALLLFAPILSASGPVGIYAIVERVVFEPDEAHAERVQVWGAFAYVDGGASGQGLETSRAARGYLYFTLPRLDLRGATPDDVPNARREWADLKAIAGTGQAVGFGEWLYSGRFEGLSPDASKNNPPHIFQRSAPGSEMADFRVRPASEAPAAPAAYQPRFGLVKLAESSHAMIIKRLRDALK
jgi:hypothetical protein